MVDLVAAAGLAHAQGAMDPLGASDARDWLVTLAVRVPAAIAMLAGGLIVIFHGRLLATGLVMVAAGAVCVSRAANIAAILGIG